LLTTACQGYCGYAMLFIEPSDLDRAGEFYLRAREYGFSALGGYWVESGAGGSYREFEERLSELKPSDKAAIYWTATAWAGWINLNRNDPLASAQFPRARKLMEWVEQRDSNYFHAGPRWFLGVYYATLPPILGGRPDLAERYFIQADSLSHGKFLWGKMLWAKTLAVQQLDRELFTRLLIEVLNGATNEPDDLRLLNRAAAREARRLLDLSEELF